MSDSIGTLEFGALHPMGPITRKVITDIVHGMDLNGGRSPIKFLLPPSTYEEFRKELSPMHLHDAKTGCPLIMGVPIVCDIDHTGDRNV
jgi:hypothetical protein